MRPLATLTTALIAPRLSAPLFASEPLIQAEPGRKTLVSHVRRLDLVPPDCMQVLETEVLQWIATQ